MSLIDQMKRYEKGKILGKGIFGKVVKATEREVGDRS